MFMPGTDWNRSWVSVSNLPRMSSEVNEVLDHAALEPLSACPFTSMRPISESPVPAGCAHATEPRPRAARPRSCRDTDATPRRILDCCFMHYSLDVDIGIRVEAPLSACAWARHRGCAS